MALTPATMQAPIKAQLLVMPFKTKDKDGNDITIVGMSDEAAESWSNALAQAFFNILTVQADVVNNNGAPVPVQVVVPAGTGFTTIPVTGKLI